MTLFDHEPLFTELTSLGVGDWANSLREQSAQALNRGKHGNLETWIAAFDRLPEATDATLNATGDAVTVSGTIDDRVRNELRRTLMAFHPWRKGPFDLFGISIDTEWRSCLKWDRIAEHVNFLNRRVLDVGCGNGYYGWRMLHAGAKLVLGIDPFLLYLMQFEVIRRYADSSAPLFVLPLSDESIPKGLKAFDVTCSMGVLYHRTSPIDHLQTLWNSLIPGGTLVLETLVIDADQQTVLVPEDRYAKMRNVWFIPSIPLLLLWLKRVGFRDARVIDVTRTTASEQRRTEWMTFESLADFLDPADATMTIEGYPAPVRAVVVANRAS